MLQPLGPLVDTDMFIPGSTYLKRKFYHVKSDQDLRCSFLFNIFLAEYLSQQADCR